MGLVLYDHPVSSNALKVRILLAELGLEYERRHVPFARPRPAEYLALNPYGGIPTLVDGDVTLAESQAILRYLAAREGRDDLHPREAGRRARVDWLLDAWTTAARPALFRLEAPVLFATGDMDAGEPHPADADPAAVEQALPQTRAGLAPFERLCGDDGTVCGGGFTIADCAVAPALARSRSLPLDLDPEFPKLARIRDAATARESFAAAGFVA